MYQMDEIHLFNNRLTPDTVRASKQVAVAVTEKWKKNLQKKTQNKTKETNIIIKETDIPHQKFFITRSY